jgi:hypothetical protein
MPHITPIRDTIARLEQRLFTCDWSDVLNIQNKIKVYQDKLNNGILFEPDF